MALIWITIGVMFCVSTLIAHNAVEGLWKTVYTVMSQVTFVVFTSFTIAILIFEVMKYVS